MGAVLARHLPGVHAEPRSTDFYDQGLPKRKYVRGLIVEADTLNEAVWLELIKDGNTVAYQLPSQHNGRKIQEYGVTPFDTALLSVRPQSAAGKRYKFFKYIWVLDEYPFLATTVTPWDDAGSLGPKWIEGMELKADTAGAQSGVDVEFQLEGPSSGVPDATWGQIVKAVVVFKEGQNLTEKAVIDFCGERLQWPREQLDPAPLIGGHDLRQLG